MISCEELVLLFCLCIIFLLTFNLCLGKKVKQNVSGKEVAEYQRELDEEENFEFQRRGPRVSLLSATLKNWKQQQLVR